MRLGLALFGSVVIVAAPCLADSLCPERETADQTSSVIRAADEPIRVQQTIDRLDVNVLVSGYDTTTDIWDQNELTRKWLLDLVLNTLRGDNFNFAAVARARSPLSPYLTLDCLRRNGNVELNLLVAGYEQLERQGPDQQWRRQPKAWICQYQVSDDSDSIKAGLQRLFTQFAKDFRPAPETLRAPEYQYPVDDDIKSSGNRSVI